MNKEISENLKRFLENANVGKNKNHLHHAYETTDEEIRQHDEKNHENSEYERKNNEENINVNEMDNDEEEIVSYLYSKDEKTIENSFYDIQKKQSKKDRKNIGHNSLSEYFRRPSISIKLPSQGLYNENIRLLPTGEVSIFPLTAKDEIWLKNPDAVLNGTAIVEIVKNCCPAVKNENVFDMLINDINAILMAIQRATYGQTLEMRSSCSYCQKENILKIDMDLVLSQVELLQDSYAYFVNSDKFVEGSEEIGKMSPDLAVFINPSRYGSLIPYTLVSFEENKIVQILEKTSEKEEKEKEIQKHLQRIHEINLQFMADSISYVVTPEGKIFDDKKSIHEFILNSPLGVYRKIEKFISHINSIGVPSEWFYECRHCNKENKTNIKYDPQNFL